MGNRQAIRLAALAAAAVFPAAAGFAGAAAGGETGRKPMSAIDWLSDSVALPEKPPAEPAPSGGSEPPSVSVAPLDAAVPDRAGLIPAAEVGLDPAIWGRSAAADLAAAVAALPDPAGAPPSLTRFLRDLMVARLDPPVDAAGDDSLFLARIDMLLTLGRLSDARALIEAAGPAGPRRFRRAFDIALLTGTEAEACKTVGQTPDISPTFPVRIYCLSRNGQYDVAALTYGTAEALNLLTPDEDQVLMHFLDPVLFEGDPIPPPPALPTPLDFRLYEAIGERIATEPLPVAFAAADLTDTVGWKTRLRAAERLAGAGEIDMSRMLAIYAERRPAASGGIWDRVAAVETLHVALTAGDKRHIEDALPPAWAAARDGGYGPAFAVWLAPRLEGLALTGSARHDGFEIALLAGEADLAARFADPSRQDAFLVALARGQTAAAPADDLFGIALRRGLAGAGPGERFRSYLDDGRPGEALLRALAVLSDGAAGNPDAAGDALALLRSLGLGGLARQVAVELLLKEGEA